MQVFKKEIALKKEILTYFDSEMLLFDIETLGLSPRNYPIYLIGCMYREKDAGIEKLYFAESTKDEPLIIKAFSDILGDFKKLVTFNGIRFDIPFVMQRAAKHHIDIDLYSFDQLDLYKVAKKHKELLGLTRLRQKSLEEFMGLFREDEYDGGALISVYKQFERNRDEKLKELLLLHNYEDVKGMTTLLPLLSYDRLNKSTFNIFHTDTSDPQRLIFKARCDISIPKPIRIINDICHIRMEGDIISGSLSLYSGTLRYYHKNTKDYVYLPAEGKIIPKVLAASISKEYKEKATRENCYSQDDGIFLPLPSGNKIKSFLNLSEEKLFAKDHNDKTRYIRLYGKEAANENSPADARLISVINGMLSYSFS